MADSISLGPENSFRSALPALQVPDFVRTAAQNVTTAVLRIFQLDPAVLYAPYRAEHKAVILQCRNEINDLSAQLPSNDTAVTQHIFARLAKNLSYCDFSVFAPEEAHLLVFKIPIAGKIVEYHFDRTLSLAEFCGATVLKAKGHPPIIIVPGTFPRLDNPGRFWETMGANLQGSAWKPVADDLRRQALPLLSDLQPSAYFIGHSAGASAIRQLLSSYKRLPPKTQQKVLNARFHAFSPPATSKTRADIINSLKKDTLISYVEAKDPISHLGGAYHAGTVLFAPPDARSLRQSHSAPPPLHYLGNHVVVPYTASYANQWSLHLGLSKASIALIAVLNLTGINALVSTTTPIIKAAVLTISRLLGTAILLTLAILSLRLKQIPDIASKGAEGTAKGITKLTLSVALMPFRFVYAYWNKIIAPALFYATGKHFYLESRTFDILLH